MEELEKILNYNFKNKELLKEALTHPSLSVNKKIKNYERLEFLGDSILSMVIIEYLYKKYKNEKEGQLSKRKSYLVSKDILSNIARNMNIGKYIIMTKGEEKSGGRDNKNNLENVMEAIIGAIYLDSNIYTVRKFILNIWEPIDKEEKTPHNDPKTKLQEWSQKIYKQTPEYKLIKEEETADNRKIFYIKLTLPNGINLKDSGYNIKEIEEKLAQNMLKTIEKKCFDL